MNFLNEIKIYPLQVIYKVTEPIKIPKFFGNLIRGLLGHSLKSVYCTNPDEKNCSNCDRKYDCTFADFYQGIIKDKSGLSEKYQKFTNFPARFSIKPLYYYNDTFSFGINFIGDLKSNFHILIQMLENVKNFKPDKYSNGRLIFDSLIFNDKVYFYNGRLVDDNFSQVEFDNIMKDYLLLHFDTPTRITDKGRLIKDELNGEILTRKIVERTELLINLYSDIKDLPKVEEEALNVVDKRLRWYDIKHRSNRQKTIVKLGGFVGDIKVRIQDKNIIPYLQLLEYMHLGANAKAGYGNFEILEI